MGYTDKELRDATQIAYMDLGMGYNELFADKIAPPYTIRQIINATPVERVRLDLEEKIVTGDFSVDLNSWKIMQVHDTNNVNGFYGCIIETSDKEAIVAFRGSESETSKQFEYDWVNADIGLVNSTLTTQHAEMDKFIKKIQDRGYLNKYTSVASTGHSLGGNLSDYFTIRSVDFGYSNKITQSISFDGPGFSREFLDLYKTNIDVASKVMKHLQWSAVGNLLFPVPGIKSLSVKIKKYDDIMSYLQKDYNKSVYNLIGRHDTRSLQYDEQGNIITGEMDVFAWFMGKLTKGFDRLPSIIGNSMISVLTYVLLHGEKIKGLFADENGLTPLGIGLVTSIAVGVLSNPAGTFVVAAEVITGTIATILVLFEYECIIEFIDDAIEKTSKLLSKIMKFAKEEIKVFKNLLDAAVLKIKDLAKDAALSVIHWAIEVAKVETIVISEIRDYSSDKLQELKSLYSLISSIDFYDICILTKKYAYEIWFSRLNISYIQSVASYLINSIRDTETIFFKQVAGVFEEVQALDDSFAEYLNKKADELNAIAGLLD